MFLQIHPFPTLRISPLGLVPKKKEDFGVVYHLSYSPAFSVNGFIDEFSCLVKHSSVDDAVELIQNWAALWKIDIKSTFRPLPIWPVDFDLLGFAIDWCMCFDKMLLMVVSCSCVLFKVLYFPSVGS